MNYYLISRRLLSNIGNFSKKRPAIFFTNILLTYHCTQRCLQCAIPAKKSFSNSMYIDTFSRIIDRLADYGTQGVTLSGGEPMCHPRLPEFISLAAQKKFYNLQLLTTLYAPEKVVKQTIDAVLKNHVSISCSFDGFDDVADKLRGVKNASSIVSDNILRFHKENQNLSKPVKTYLNIVLSQLNLHQIVDILKFAENIQWPVNLDLYRWTSDNHREQDEMKIEDFDLLRSVVTMAKNSPLVITPSWLLDGYVDYLHDHYQKFCPYLDNHSMGSKFFIHPNGDMHVCMGPAIGNITRQSPKEIFSSTAWQNHISACKTCPGCWNTCYTPVSRPLHYFNRNDFKIARRLFTKDI